MGNLVSGRYRSAAEQRAPDGAAPTPGAPQVISVFCGRVDIPSRRDFEWAMVSR